MKTITIQIKDETAEALDTAAQSYDYRKYPMGQAYSLIIDELVRDIQNLTRCSPLCCSSSPEHPTFPGMVFLGKNKNDILYLLCL
jgi:hypothetical protein